MDESLHKESVRLAYGVYIYRAYYWLSGDLVCHVSMHIYENVHDKFLYTLEFLFSTCILLLFGYRKNVNCFLRVVLLIVLVDCVRLMPEISKNSGT